MHFSCVINFTFRLLCQTSEWAICTTPVGRSTHNKLREARVACCVETDVTTTTYTMSKRVAMPYPKAVTTVTEALAAEGFGILTSIDVKKTLREKVGAEVEDWVILGACNPALAYAALKADADVSLLLPCNVVVRAAGEFESIVSIMEPGIIARLSGAEGLDEVLEIARAKLERVLEQVEGASS